MSAEGRNLWVSRMRQSRLSGSMRGAAAVIVLLRPLLYGPPITAPPQPRSRVDRNPAAVFRAAVNGYERGQIALYSGQD